MPATSDTVRSGLSPRARGNRDEAKSKRPCARSIPACAGEPVSWPRSPRRNQVYPRVRGGTGAVDLERALDAGLSPRARGNPSCRRCARRHRRSIPACAGEPVEWLDHCSMSRVYPRVRGGTIVPARMGDNDPGLSPRARGNRLRWAADGRRSGSIPACAGEPFSDSLFLAAEQVYPRVRGGTSTACVAFR